MVPSSFAGFDRVPYDPGQALATRRGAGPGGVGTGTPKKRRSRVPTRLMAGVGRGARAGSEPGKPEPLERGATGTETDSRDPFGPLAGTGQESGGRPGWDAYFMAIARTVGTRSTCLRRSVGAVLVRDRRILTSGYNGAPRGLPHCQEVGCELENGHCVRAVHAEINAVVQAALHGVSTEGATLYCTSQPCYACAKVIVNAGVVRVVDLDAYDDPRSVHLFNEARVERCRPGRFWAREAQ